MCNYAVDGELCCKCEIMLWMRSSAVVVKLGYEGGALQLGRKTGRPRCDKRRVSDYSDTRRIVGATRIELVTFRV